MKTLLFLLVLVVGLNASGWSQIVANTSTIEKQPLTMQKFNSLMRVMKDQKGDAARAAIFRETLGVNSNYFTIYQLGQLLMLISAESDRLDLAKKSLTHVLEEANFYALADLFTSQNKDELLYYIATNKPQFSARQ